MYVCNVYMCTHVIIYMHIHRMWLLVCLWRLLERLCNGIHICIQCDSYAYIHECNTFQTMHTHIRTRTHASKKPHTHTYMQVLTKNNALHAILAQATTQTHTYIHTYVQVLIHPKPKTTKRSSCHLSTGTASHEPRHTNPKQVHLRLIRCRIQWP
jgi:hypothetical protein